MRKNNKTESDFSRSDFWRQISVKLSYIGHEEFTLLSHEIVAVKALIGEEIRSLENKGRRGKPKGRISMANFDKYDSIVADYEARLEAQGGKNIGSIETELAEEYGYSKSGTAEDSDSGKRRIRQIVHEDFPAILSGMTGYETTHESVALKILEAEGGYGPRQAKKRLDEIDSKARAKEAEVEKNFYAKMLDKYMQGQLDLDKIRSRMEPEMFDRCISLLEREAAEYQNRKSYSE